MWFRVSEGTYVPVSGLVGFFRPDALPLKGAGKLRDGADTEDAADVAEGKEAMPKAVVLMKDGRVLGSPFTVASLAKRLEAARGVNADSRV